ncbi:MAG: DciA family protein [Patescibacteria group bacterium]
MRHIKSIIVGKTANRIIQKVDENIVCEKVKQIIKQKSTEDFEVLFYKNKNVYVKCFNAVFANELNLMQEEIKREINDLFRKTVLNKLIIKIG